MVSGIETLVIDNDTRPVIVGERTNVLGSRKFKRLVADGKFEEASEVGRVQVRRGARSSTYACRTPIATRWRTSRAFSKSKSKKSKCP